MDKEDLEKLKTNPEGYISEIIKFENEKRKKSNRKPENVFIVDENVLNVIIKILFNIHRFDEITNINEFVWTLYTTIVSSKTITINSICEEQIQEEMNANNENIKPSIFKTTDEMSPNEHNVTENYSFVLTFNTPPLEETVYIQKLMENALKEDLISSITDFEKKLKNTMIRIGNGNIIDFYNNHNLLHIYGLPYPYIIHKIIDYIETNNSNGFNNFNKKAQTDIRAINLNKNKHKVQIEKDMTYLIQIWSNSPNHNLLKDKINKINKKIIEYYSQCKGYLSNVEYIQIMKWIDTTKCISDRLDTLKYTKTIEDCCKYTESIGFLKIYATYKEKLTNPQNKANEADKYFENKINNMLNFKYLPIDQQKIIKEYCLNRIKEIDELLNRPTAFKLDNELIKYIKEDIQDDKEIFKRRDLLKLLGLLYSSNKGLINISDYQRKIITILISKECKDDITCKKIIEKAIDYYSVSKYKLSKEGIINQNIKNNLYDDLDGRYLITYNDNEEIEYLNNYFALDFYNSILNNTEAFSQIIEAYNKKELVDSIWKYYNDYRDSFPIELTYNNLKIYIEDAIKTSENNSLEKLNNIITTPKELDEIFSQLPRNNICNLIIIEQIKKGYNDKNFQKKYEKIYKNIGLLPKSSTCFYIQKYGINEDSKQQTEEIQKIYEECDFKISWENLIKFLKGKKEREEKNTLVHGFDTAKKINEITYDPESIKYINYLVIFKYLLENDLIPIEISPIYTKVFWKLNHIKSLTKIKDIKFALGFTNISDKDATLISDSTQISFSKNDKERIMRISSIRSDNKKEKQVLKLFPVDIIYPIPLNFTNEYTELYGEIIDIKQDEFRFFSYR